MEDARMKEIIRQYGASVIAAVVGAALMLVIMQLPLGGTDGIGNRLLQSEALSVSADNTAFEGYWRSR
jgi:hypothetical protein